MKVVEVPPTERMDGMSVENGSTAKVRVVSLSDYFQAAVAMKIKQVGAWTFRCIFLASRT